MSEQERIKWYRSPVDKETLARLTERSDMSGFCHMIPQLLFSTATGTAAYFSWRYGPWWLTVIACYFHAMFYHFLALSGCGHELTHRTVFKSRFWNEFFLWITSFLTMYSFYFFRASHSRHHQVTVHHELDMEVVLPIKIRPIEWFYFFTIHWPKLYAVVNGLIQHSLGRISGEWADVVMPPSDAKARRQVVRWARTLLIGHILLAAIFIYSGQWIFLFLVTFAIFYGEWLNFLCAGSQHIGLRPDVPDFRQCARSYMLNPFVRFFYANMNYHLEHHMYAAVPFYNLPKLRRVIEKDIPKAKVGLWATWKEIFYWLKKHKTNPDFILVPELPSTAHPLVA